LDLAVVTRGKKIIEILFIFSHKPLVSCLRPSVCTYIYE